MPARQIDPADRLLASGLALDGPFSSQDATEAGLGARWLRRMVEAGVLTRPLRGVYLPVGVTDCLDVRLASLRLVLPSECVITDRTAGWLHGAPMTLAPNDHLIVPQVSAFHLPHHRLNNATTESGARALTNHDIVEIGGLPVTTPLRTACDLGRLLNRDSAFAALDALLRLGSFSHEALIAEVKRFKGFRGVRQLRAFAPLADPGSESFGESALRLRWYDACLAVAPETQIVVHRTGFDQSARLDLGSSRYRYAAEYDGERFHGADRADHDRQRRRWIRDELGWTVGVFRREDVFGRHHTAISRLRSELSRAKVQVQRASAY